MNCRIRINEHTLGRESLCAMACHRVPVIEMLMCRRIEVDSPTVIEVGRNPSIGPD